MIAPNDNLPRHKNDFGRVYDLEDPGPYFNALRPSDFRMPEVLAGTLKAIHREVCAARNTGDTLRVLDFACGYGAVGALLRHRISMRELYARYARRHWRPDDGRTHWESDEDFFAARRERSQGFEIGGTDIAGIALEYAAAMGFLDRTFHANLIDHAPGEALGQFVRGVDLVVESGSLGELLPAAFERILDCGAGAGADADGGGPGFSTAPVPTRTGPAWTRCGRRGATAPRAWGPSPCATESRWERPSEPTCFGRPERWGGRTGR